MPTWAVLRRKLLPALYVPGYQLRCHEQNRLSILEGPGKTGFNPHALDLSSNSPAPMRGMRMNVAHFVAEGPSVKVAHGSQEVPAYSITYLQRKTTM
jgi:hypothetical protein